MYINIQTSEVKNIVTGILNNNYQITEEEKKDISIEHNYLQFNDQYYKQEEGLAMGMSTSVILAVIFTQHLEYMVISRARILMT
jgi:hypothetical protein